MKVAIVCTLYQPYVLGGAEISTQYLAEGLKDAGVDVFVITSGEKEGVDYVNGVKVYRLENKNIYWRYPQREKPLAKKTLWHLIDGYVPLYEKAIKKILEAEKPDVVHTGNTCGISCFVWRTAHKAAIPVVHTLRDYSLLCPAQTMTKNGSQCQRQCLSCRWFTKRKKGLSKHVDAVVGISSYILGKHLEAGYFPNAKTQETIPNSVSQFEGKANRGNRIIGYLGRLSREKGIELLIKAFSSIKDPSVKLLIAGDGNSDYVDRLKSQTKDSRIEFVGHRKNTQFLNEIDLLVVPSLWAEPFGRVAIEAYSAHCPVIMAKNGGLEELIRPGLSYGFDTKDETELSDLLHQFTAGELKFDNSNRTSVLDDFSHKGTLEKYMNLYSNLSKCACQSEITKTDNT